MQQREDNEAESEKKESVEKEEQQNKQIRDMGQVILNENSNKYKVELLTTIGVPMAVSADYSFVVPSATMVIHPVRTNGMFIGVAQSYRNMEKIQDRITTFISSHTHMSQERLEELMLDTTQLVKDVGTMLEGPEAVKEGLIDEVGGMKEALGKLYELIGEEKSKSPEK